MRSLCNKPLSNSVLIFFLFPKIHFICHFTFYFIFWLPVVSFMILDMYKTKAQLEVPDYIKFTGPNNHVKRDAELTVRSDDQGMASIEMWSASFIGQITDITVTLLFLSFIYMVLLTTQYFGNQLYNVYLLNRRRKMNFKVSFLYNLKLEQMLIIVYYVISFRECMVYKTNNMKQRENKWVFNKNQPTSSRENYFSYSVCLHIESALCFKSLGQI